MSGIRQVNRPRKLTRMLALAAIATVAVSGFLLGGSHAPGAQATGTVAYVTGTVGTGGWWTYYSTTSRYHNSGPITFNPENKPSCASGGIGAGTWWGANVLTGAAYWNEQVADMPGGNPITKYLLAGGSSWIPNHYFYVAFKPSPIPASCSTIHWWDGYIDY